MSADDTTVMRWLIPFSTNGAVPLIGGDTVLKRQNCLVGVTIQFYPVGMLIEDGDLDELDSEATHYAPECEGIMDTVEDAGTRLGARYVIDADNVTREEIQMWKVIKPIMHFDFTFVGEQANNGWANPLEYEMDYAGWFGFMTPENVAGLLELAAPLIVPLESEAYAVSFISVWEYESGYVRYAEGDEFDVDYWLKGRLDVKTLTLIALVKEKEGKS